MWGAPGGISQNSEPKANTGQKNEPFHPSDHGQRQKLNSQTS
jgi:hypothetical protein